LGAAASVGLVLRAGVALGLALGLALGFTAGLALLVGFTLPAFDLPALVFGLGLPAFLGAAGLAVCTCLVFGAATAWVSVGAAGVEAVLGVLIKRSP
jgi:hypothetical protein